MTSIRVVGGPWPERIGLEGTVAEPTAEQAKRYPFKGRLKTEIIIYIPNDPLYMKYGYTDDGWTCATDRKDVEEVR